MNNEQESFLRLETGLNPLLLDKFLKTNSANFSSKYDKFSLEMKLKVKSDVDKFYARFENHLEKDYRNDLVKILVSEAALACIKCSVNDIYMQRYVCSLYCIITEKFSRCSGGIAITVLHDKFIEYFGRKLRDFNDFRRILLQSNSALEIYQSLDQLGLINIYDHGIRLSSSMLVKPSSVDYLDMDFKRLVLPEDDRVVCYRLELNTSAVDYVLLSKNRLVGVKLTINKHHKDQRYKFAEKLKEISFIANNMSLEIYYVWLVPDILLEYYQQRFNMQEGIIGTCGMMISTVTVEYFDQRLSETLVKRPALAKIIADFAEKLYGEKLEDESLIDHLEDKQEESRPNLKRKTFPEE